MAVYKVPQDVEADDKLIGPFSFRQFVYLAIVAGAIGLAWVLGRLFIPLAILPLPIILFFGALALPLRKDQPMETYLAAIVSFYIKPRRRTWEPDGQQSLVQITAPKVVEVKRTKGLSDVEAERRLTYLASIVDSRGWAVRGVDSEPINTSVNPAIYREAQVAQDVLDTANPTAHNIENQLDQTNQRHHQELVNRLMHPVAMPEVAQTVAPAPVPTSAPVAPVANPYTTLGTVANDDPSIHLNLNPYPTMQQSILQPIDPSAPTAAPQPATSPETTSKKPLSPDIINLANNPDLSIETIAHEANRIKEKQRLPDDEVVVSLH